jgi:chromosome segregation ATPase
MDDKPTQDLATRAFQKRVLDEFAAVRREQAATRGDIAEIRADITEIRTQQFAIAKNVAALDERLTTLEQRVDDRLKETRPIWEAVQEQLRKLDKKFDLAIKDLFELRSDVASQDRRIGDLEPRVLPST